MIVELGKATVETKAIFQEVGLVDAPGKPFPQWAGVASHR